jgi:hypothetical protein
MSLKITEKILEQLLNIVSYKVFFLALKEIYTIIVSYED